MRTTPAATRYWGLSMADALARLAPSTTSPSASPTSAKPEGFLERQVPRCSRSWSLYQEYDGYPGPQIPGIDEVSAWLETAPADDLDARHHARRLSTPQRDVLPDRPGRGRDRRLGDVHDRRPTAGPGLAAVGPGKQSDGFGGVQPRHRRDGRIGQTGELLQRYAANTTRDL